MIRNPSEMPCLQTRGAANALALGLLALLMLAMLSGCSVMTELQSRIQAVVAPRIDFSSPPVPAVAADVPEAEETLAESPAPTSNPGEAKAKPLSLNGRIEPGTQDPVVKDLQQFLADKGFYRGPIDGGYGTRTRAAVIAVHKALGMSRTSVWQGQELEKLRAYAGPSLVARKGQSDRLEIDLNRQLLYLIKKGKVIATLPISSGNGALYENDQGQKVKAVTPAGNFTLYNHYSGWRTSYLGELYWPWYFSGGYAVHGSRSVPPSPASHGCVRVHMWDADYLNQQLSLGMPVYIWGGSQGRQKKVS